MPSPSLLCIAIIFSHKLYYGHISKFQSSHNLVPSYYRHTSLLFYCINCSWDALAAIAWSPPPCYLLASSVNPISFSFQTPNYTCELTTFLNSIAFLFYFKKTTTLTLFIYIHIFRFVTSMKWTSPTSSLRCNNHHPTSWSRTIFIIFSFFFIAISMT
jgi:hypothetical protein